MNLNVKNWKEFKLGQLFTPRTGYYNNKPDTSDYGIPFLGGSDSNNGRTCYVSYDAVLSTNKTGKPDSKIEGKIFSGNCITVTTDGSVCYAYYQPKEFTGSHSFIALYPKSFVLNKEIALFICSVINKERYRFSYGRKIHSEAKMKQFIIKLPAQNNEPDFDYMVDYIRSLNCKQITTSNNNDIHLKLQVENWKEYPLKKLFKIKPGKYHYPDEYEEGNTPYVSASNINNGIAQRINLKPEFQANCIVTGKVGCTAFYQSEDFCATSDVNIFIPENFTLNKYIGLFLVSVINKSENYKWSYGRQCRVGDSKKIIIKLPTKTTPDGNPVIDETKKYSKEGYIPDWEYMENYIKSLPYGDRI